MADESLSVTITADTADAAAQMAAFEAKLESLGAASSNLQNNTNASGKAMVDSTAASYNRAGEIMVGTTAKTHTAVLDLKRRFANDSLLLQEGTEIAAEQQAVRAATRNVAIQVSSLNEQVRYREMTRDRQIAILTEMSTAEGVSAEEIVAIRRALTVAIEQNNLAIRVSEEKKLAVVEQVAGQMARVAGRQAGLLKGLGGFMGATGPAIAATAAFVALYQIIKDVVGVAEQFQGEMNTLGAAVEAQGGNWSDLSDGVQHWADTEALASGIAQDELIPSLNSLVTAGIRLSDAQKMVGVAEEVAIGTHKRLATVVEALKAAEAGRGIALVRLDTHLKNLIHTHGKMSDAMKILHHDFEKQLSLDKSLERAHGRLKAETEAVSRSIGNALLPAVIDMQYGFLGGMKAAGLLGKGIGEVFHGIVIEVASAAEAVGHFAEALGNLAKLDFKGAAAQFGEARSAAQRFQFGGAIAMEGGADFTEAMGMSWVNAGRHSAGAAVKAHQDALDNLDLQNDPNFGFGKAAHHGAGHHASKHHSAAHHHAKSLGAEYNFKEMSDGLKPGKKAADDFDAALSRLPHTIAGITTAMAELKKRINDETAAQTELTLKQAQAKTLYEDLRAVYNAYGASLGKHPTKAEKEQLAELANGVKDAKTQYEHLTVAVDANAAALKKHTDEAKKDLEELAAKHKEAFDKMHSQAEKYANEVIGFFEKMGKSGKGIFKDLELAFATMIENMIKKFIESKLTDIFMAFMSKGSTASAAAPAVGGFMSFLSGVGVGPGATPSLVSTTSGQAVAVHIAGMDSSLLGGPGSSFANMGMSGIGFGLALAGGAAGLGGIIGGLEGHQNGAKYGAVGGLVGGAAGGLGALLAGFGGGAFGGLGAGLSMFTPAGWALLLAGVVGGGLLGGAFGGPKMNVNQNPDQVASSFGQDVANAQGSAYTQQGGNFTAQGPTQLSIIDAFVQAHPGGAGLTGAQLATWNQANSLTAGGTAISEHGLNQGNIGLSTSMDPNAPLIGGTKMPWQQLADQLAGLTKAITSNTSALQAPVFTISRTYPDFNASSIAGAPGAGKPGNGLPGQTGVPGEGGTGGHTRPGRGDGGGDINVTIQGSVIGTGGVHEVALAISQELSKLNNGHTFYAGAGARRFGNF